MNELQIFSEICSVFKDAFGGRENFKFVILQPAGGFCKSLTIPQVSSQYKWSASSVAGKNSIVPIYILAQEPLKVRNYCKYKQRIIYITARHRGLGTCPPAAGEVLIFYIKTLDYGAV